MGFFWPSHVLGNFEGVVRATIPLKHWWLHLWCVSQSRVLSQRIFSGWVLRQAPYARRHLILPVDIVSAWHVSPSYHSPVPFRLRSLSCILELSERGIAPRVRFFHMTGGQKSNRMYRDYQHRNQHSCPREVFTPRQIVPGGGLAGWKSSA